MKDLYKILGVRKEASKEEIKKAYRALAEKYHPDRNSGDVEAEKMFIEVNKAYEILSDEKLKKEYVYINTPEDYEEKAANEIVSKFDRRIIQNDLDNLENGISKYFIYSDDKSWGFYVQGIKRENDKLYAGKKKYYPFEDNSNSVSYFDGEH